MTERDEKTGYLYTDTMNDTDPETGFRFINQPGLINIDVTGLCNKTCNYCPRSSGYPNQKEYMDWELFRKFVLDLEKYTGMVDFTGRGENSLHPEFGLLVKLLHHPARKYKTRIITNGYKLKQRLHYFDEFDVNFYNNDYAVGINCILEDDEEKGLSVLIKTYTPIPSKIAYHSLVSFFPKAFDLK